MGNADGANAQSANIVPPRADQILKSTLDTSFRRKDLGCIAPFGDFAAVATSDDSGKGVFMTFRSDVKMFIRFSSSPSLEQVDTAADAANVTTPTLGSRSVTIEATQPFECFVDRWLDRFMYVKGSAAGTLEYWPSSGVHRG